MEYIYIGRIVNTHGIKGELRIKSNFLEKEKVFKKGMILYIGEGYVPEEIVTYRSHKDFDMVTFAGYDNINQVLNYLKMKVYVKREDLELNDEEYVLEEIIGFSVIENDKILGKVREIVYNGSNILLGIEASKNFYIPYRGNFIKKVNVKNGEVMVENAEGLIL